MISRRNLLTMLGLAPVVATVPAVAASSYSEADSLRKTIGKIYDNVKPEWSKDAGVIRTKDGRFGFVEPL